MANLLTLPIAPLGLEPIRRPASLQESVQGAGAILEVVTYPGNWHLFADPGGPDYDSDSAKLMLGRELDFLRRLKG
jgi:dienelactone hydrolase